MLKSTDKLRTRIIDSTLSNQTREEFERIADQIELEVSERYMLRPIDADGVPWTAKDREFNDVVDDAIKLNMIAYSVKTGRWYLVDDKKMTYTAGVCRHVKPRTVEDVLHDVWNEAIDYAKSDMWRNPDEVFAERADEIRDLLGGDAE